MLFKAIQHNSKTRSAAIGGGMFNLFGGVTSKSGKPVNTTTALTLSAFYNGLEMITNDFAKLPKGVYQNKDNKRKRATSHSNHYLISKKPNQFMTEFMFHKMLVLHAIAKGNGYGEIERDSFTGFPKAIQLVDQDKTPVTVKKSNNKLYYHFNNKVVAAENMVHIPGFSFNGITGISVIQHAANSLGVALSSQEFSSEYYNSKGAGTIILAANNTMDAAAKTRYAQAFKNHLDKPGQIKVAVADDIKGVQHINLTPAESQFLQTNKFAVEEIARWLNIPTHKLKSTENSNYSNMESQNISHVAESMIPWIRKVEQEYDAKLFSTTDRISGYYVKMNTGILLMADKKTQAEYYSKMVSIGVMQPNEVRGLMELNAVDGLDENFIPVNLQSLETLAIKNKQLQKELDNAE